MTRGDDLQPTCDDYNTIIDCQCPVETATKTREVKRVERCPPSSTFKIEVETLKTVEPIQRRLIVLDVLNQKGVEPGSSTSTSRIEVEILKIVKPT